MKQNSNFKGLVTYREKYLLFNPAKDSIFNKRLITLVVAHELAHQWVDKNLIQNSKPILIVNTLSLEI